MENNISKEIYKKLDNAKVISSAYPNKSYTMSKEAYEMAKENNLKAEEGYALISMSFACRAKSQINKMLEYSFNAFEIFEEINIPIGQAKSLNLIGIAYFYSSMYEEALKYLLQAENLLKDLNENFLLSCVINNIGEICRESEEYEKALKYYYRSLKICTENNLKVTTASIFSNIGEIYFIESKFDEALVNFTKSYDILIEENDMVNLGEVENKLGKVHLINKNYSKAEEYLFSSLRRLDKVDNKFYAIDVLANLAKLEIEKGSNRALYYFEKAMEYAEKTNAKKKLSEVCKTLADYYEKIGNYKDSLEYFKKYYRVNQEITASITGNKFEIFKIEFSHLKESSELEKAKVINKRLEIEISKQRSQLEKIQEINKVLEKTAFEDELTGIPNRRYINYHLNITLEEALLQDENLAFFIIDIDNFKLYNDFWGHLQGDKCLIKIADCLKNIQSLRKHIFGRFGGEEFIYYAKGINYDEALELGNLIRTEVENLNLKYSSDESSKVLTISVGGVQGKASAFNDISDMIEIADKELYKAKNMGRNITLLHRWHGDVSSAT